MHSMEVKATISTTSLTFRMIKFLDLSSSRSRISKLISISSLEELALSFIEIIAITIHYFRLLDYAFILIFFLSL
jgi:hypothetical protein